MKQRLPKQATHPDPLPWQAALMVVCVTAAGLLHEHPGAVRPLVSLVHTAPLQAGLAHGTHAADLLDAALLPLH